MTRKQYIAIDLKSFYASVECVQRGLDPLKTNLVVADPQRTEKTICLAVTPSLKAFGIPGRARLFEVVESVRQVNARRKELTPGKQLHGSSYDADLLAQDPSLAVDYIIAPPQMSLYMQTSAAIYNIYLKYVAPEDIHVYSVDEVFIDATPYLHTYGLTARELAQKMILDVLQTYGITATAGIGTNLYLCKVAMDVVAKKIPPDANGVRIAELNEATYRHLLWDHEPLTDFWRVGRGYQERLHKIGIRTMGDIARCSLGDPCQFHNEALLYKLFGVNAELLIDHAWGYEPCTIADIKAYRPESNSISSGQVLHCPYTAEKARLVLREMADLLVLDLVEKELVTNQVVLTIGYDIEGVNEDYIGQITTDHYGRKIPKHAHGTENLGEYTSSTKEILHAVSVLFDRITDAKLPIRRINLTFTHVIREKERPPLSTVAQLDLFEEPCAPEDPVLREREKRRQKAVLAIKKKFGKNAILKGMNLEDGATAKDRNSQIGGHKA